VPKRWHQFRNPWDREYAMRGSLWRGVSDAEFLRPWIPPGRRVVELGCGDGKFLAGLRAAGYRVLGVDFSRHALKHARKRMPAELALADVRALPFRERTVDAVCARYVLGSLYEDGRRRAAREIERVMTPQGAVLLEEFSTQDFRAGTGSEVEERTYERNQGILTHYFEAGEAAALFPGLRVAAAEELTSTQRTGEARAPRHRLRWILVPQGPGSSKASSRVEPAGTS
jgi:ubiquinone/menaquinone biosynthesis C-methylase UbiE